MSLPKELKLREDRLAAMAAPNDKQQVQPMIKVRQDQAPRLGNVETLIADTGYCSEANVKACMDAGGYHTDAGHGASF